MSALHYVRTQVFPSTFGLLPPKMDGGAARAMLLAIGLQESRFEYRRQIGGPARGFWQFEYGGGFHGVLRHHASKVDALDVLQKLAYQAPEFDALTHNDILACAFARLLLWTHPDRLPGRAEGDNAWRYYLDTWRPGKPHPETWPAFWEQAWRELSVI